jgi:hypothetical protein
MILYYYIYPTYLGSWYCPKGFLLWPLVGTEQVGMRSANLSGYSVGSHLFIFHFDTFTGCGPVTLGWYSVGVYPSKFRELKSNLGQKIQKFKE